MTISLPQPVYPGTMHVDEFQAFLETRPKGERWQLIEGVAVMMNPPTYVHQRIGLNLAMHLNSAFSESDLDFFAYVEGRVRAPGIVNFQPAPDVVVVPGTAGYRSYEENFALVAEILSPTNTPSEIGFKVARYRAVETNNRILVIDSRSVSVEIQSRKDDWEARRFASLNDAIELPEFRFRATLRDLYRGTPLDPSRKSTPRH